MTELDMAGRMRTCSVAGNQVQRQAARLGYRQGLAQQVIGSQQPQDEDATQAE